MGENLDLGFGWLGIVILWFIVAYIVGLIYKEAIKKTEQKWKRVAFKFLAFSVLFFPFLGELFYIKIVVAKLYWDNKTVITKEGYEYKKRYMEILRDKLEEVKKSKGYESSVRIFDYKTVYVDISMYPYGIENEIGLRRSEIIDKKTNIFGKEVKYRIIRSYPEKNNALLIETVDVYIDIESVMVPYFTGYRDGPRDYENQFSYFITKPYINDKAVYYIAGTLLLVALFILLFSFVKSPALIVALLYIFYVFGPDYMKQTGLFKLDSEYNKYLYVNKKLEVVDKWQN